MTLSRAPAAAVAMLALASGAASAEALGTRMTSLMDKVCLPAFPDYANFAEQAEQAGLAPLGEDDGITMYQDTENSLAVSMQPAHKMMYLIPVPATCGVSTMPGQSFADIAPAIEAFARQLDTNDAPSLVEGSVEDAEMSWSVTLPDGAMATVYAFDAGLGMLGVSLFAEPDL